MQPQAYNWTCAACAQDWVLRSTGLASPDHTQWQSVQEIGYPEYINPQYGLMQGSGEQLQRVYAEYGQPTDRAWLDFDSIYNLASTTTGQISGQRWYHWVALRGVDRGDIWIANSAPGYKGIWDKLSRADFDRLGGFGAVWLTGGS